jgi:peptidyl-prolyl cis-trans isomerase A (cyclophilin A)
MFRKLPILGALLLALALPDDAAAQAANPQVLIKTSMGEITLELYPEKAPKSVANFLQYVSEGFYPGTVFHRVIGNFMVQGGGHTKEIYSGGPGKKPTRTPVEIESKNGLKNDTGWVAMARTAQPNSATSQFFINTVDNANLNFPSFDGNGYTVFGKVIDGMKIVNAIRAVKTGNVGMFQDVPLEPVTIDAVSVIKPKS